MTPIFKTTMLAAAFQSMTAATLKETTESGVRRNTIKMPRTSEIEVEMNGFVNIERDGHGVETDPVRRARTAAEGSSKALSLAEVDELDIFNPPALAGALSALAQGSSTHVDMQIPGLDDHAVSPPCTGRCAEAAKKGIVFIGDSTTRRLYVRFVARLGRLTNEQSEMLQDNAKQWSHHAGNVPLSQFRDTTGEVPFAYSKGGMRARFEWDSQYVPENITKKVKDAQSRSDSFVFVGLPLAHMLHWEGSPSLACEAGPKFPTELESKFKQIVTLDDSSQVRVVFGNGVPYANGDRLLNLTRDGECKGMGRMHVDKCTSGVCDWIRCQSHLEKANEVYKNAFVKLAKPHMRRVDITGATLQSKLWRYLKSHSLSDGGVHYKYGLLDDQLDAILKQMVD